MVTLKDLFDLNNLQHPELFSGFTYPWEVVAKIADYVSGLTQSSNSNVVIGRGTIVEEGVVIFGPTVIGKNCHLRSGAYIRGNVIIEDNVVIGHASEIKNSLILSGSEIPHFNYVGDSIVGHNAHLAAGAILSNTKILDGEVVVRDQDQEYKTGLKKFGSAIGDNAEVGCNAVLNPGSVIGQNSIIYPLVSWRGVLPPNKIAKSQTAIVDRK